MESCFDSGIALCEAWHRRHPRTYAAQLAGLGLLLPGVGEGLEIGVGTGRFAVSLGITQGFEENAEAAAVAKKRGVEVTVAAGRELPYPAECFDYALITTGLCFATDVERLLYEAHRVVRPQGVLVVGFFDLRGGMGERLRKARAEHPLVAGMSFHVAAEMESLLVRCNFGKVRALQTLLTGIDERASEPATLLPGYGKGAYVVMRGIRDAMDFSLGF